jgi:hypothetical protein
MPHPSSFDSFGHSYHLAAGKHVLGALGQGAGHLFFESQFLIDDDT